MQAHEDGNIPLASQHLSRALHSRELPPAMRMEIATVLTEYQTQARSELESLLDQVESIVAETSPGDAKTWTAALAPEFEYRKTADHSQQDEVEPIHKRLRETIGEISALNQRYRDVPQLKREIEKAVDRLKTKHAGVARVLYEPVAQDLFAQAQELESKNEPCCAYFAYEQAAALMPCDTAENARRRADALVKIPTVRAKIDHCRSVRECQEKFDSAMSIAKSDEATAKEMLRKIVSKAPGKSGVSETAKEELARLGG